MSTFSQLFELRKSLVRFEEEIGLSELNDLERAILEFVGDPSLGDVTLTDIIQDNYFKNYSQSTLKRGLVSLIQKGLINQELGKIDRRQRILKANLI